MLTTSLTARRFAGKEAPSLVDQFQEVMFEQTTGLTTVDFVKTKE
jgi:hypothetical protein